MSLLCATWWRCSSPEAPASGSIPLTRDRAKPAVSFGGPYRIVDFTLSNCINSGLRKIFIATQYKAQSLNRHVRMGWNAVNTELGEFVEILPPQKRVGENWYLGTADAVYQNLYSIEREQPRWVIVLSGDHIYKMDYGKMLDVHIARGAALTVAAIEVPVAESRRFGVLEVDEDSRIVGLPGEARARAVRPPGTPASAWAPWGSTSSTPTCWCASCCATPRRTRATTSARTSSPSWWPRESGSTPTSSGTRTRRSRSTGATWGPSTPTTRRRWTSSRSTPSSTSTTPSGRCAPTSPSFPPPSSSSRRTAGGAWPSQSIVSTGCIVSGSEIQRSILSPNVRVHSFCDVQDSIVMPNAVINRHARIRRAIVDRDVVVPRGAIVGYDPVEDRRRHTVTEGGVVVVSPGEECLVDPAFAARGSLVFSLRKWTP